MDSMKLMKQFRARVAVHLGAPLPAITDAIMADAKILVRLAEREAHENGYCRRGVDYPLPTRTDRVLREEPVPGTARPLYRWRDGLLESNSDHRWWGPARSVSSEPARLRHLLDLHDNPYTAREIPVDPANPFGDDAGGGA